MSNAISYLRFSSKKQIGNDSYRRQITATEKYCHDNGLVINSHLEDLGVSAYSGKNLDDEAALGGFLKLVDAGKIPKGTVLICENLDRLTRGKILEAVSLFSSILKRGIDIVTTMDGKRYSYQSVSDSPMELMISITYLTRGNNESATKSKRVKEAWANKVVKISKGENTKHACPQWLKFDGSKYILIKDHAATVKLVFELYNQGQGAISVIKGLVKRGIKPFGRSKGWQPMTIHRMLESKSAIGFNDFVEPPIKNYYPAVVSDETFYKAQTQRGKNGIDRGRRNETEINLFSGLCKCVQCGGAMNKYYVTAKGGTQYSYLRCFNSKVGTCKAVMTNYDKLQDSFLFILNTANFAKMLFAGVADTKDETGELEGKLSDIKKTIARVADAVIKTDNADLVTRLAKLELERKQIEKAYDMALAAKMSKTDVKADYNELREQIWDNIKNNAFRLTLRALIRKNIKKIVCNGHCYTVYFIGSDDTIDIELSKTDYYVRYWEESETYDYFSFKGNKEHTADAVATTRK